VAVLRRGGAAALARKLGAHVLTETMERRPGIGFDSYDRFFPNQATLPQGGFGSLIALPLQKELRGDGNAPRPPGLVRERASLQAPWPPLAAMEHRDDLQTLAAHSVRNEIPCAWHHELTSPGHPTGTPEVRELRQAIDCSE
jgi:TOTE conflict system primase-like protein